MILTVFSAKSSTGLHQENNACINPRLLVFVFSLLLVFSSPVGFMGSIVHGSVVVHGADPSAYADPLPWNHF